MIQELGDRTSRRWSPASAHIESAPLVVAEQLDLVSSIAGQNARNILAGQQPVGVCEIEHGADVGIVLQIVTAERSLIVTIEFRQRVVAIELNIRKTLAKDQLHGFIYAAGI